MKIKYLLILIPLFAFQHHSFCQELTETQDTIYNQIDDMGRKQGPWRKYFQNDTLRYKGQFKNDKAIGKFEHYYDDGSLKTIVLHIDESNKSEVKHYYQNGEIAAEGAFIGNKKNGIWKYFSYYGAYLSYAESYKEGEKHGVSKKYFKNGSITQELSWENDKKEGAWKIWFPNGKLQLSANFRNGKLDGPFINYYPDGTEEIKGSYENDLRIGKWLYTELGTGKIKEIKYVNGVPENQEEMDKQFEKKMLEYEKNKGNIKDPDLNDVRIIKRKKIN